MRVKSREKKDFILPGQSKSPARAGLSIREKLLDVELDRQYYSSVIDVSAFAHKAEHGIGV